MVAHLIYATLATLGLIFILVSSQTIFLLIKILGAALHYLSWFEKHTECAQI